MDSTLATNQVASDIWARPSKRRKFYRKRGEEDPPVIEDEHKPDAVATDNVDALTLDELISHHGSLHGPDAADQRLSLSAAEIISRRKAQRRRLGIEFNNLSSGLTSSAPPERSAVVEHDDTPQMKTINDRFAPQRGQVADVDKHMMAYIDSELAKRQGHSHSTSKSNGQSNGSLSVNGALIDAGLNRQPAALGRLQEFDLGPDSTLKNIARTEAAKRRLASGDAEMEEERGKIPLRRNGKPWRGRRRRNSDDIKRDKLVEEVMRETRLEIYDEPDPEPAEEDQAADDRIAEQFRRDFMDAISSRRQRSSAAAKAAKARGAKSDDRPRGPKLGGSRSARAAMRELQEKAKK